MVVPPIGYSSLLAAPVVSYMPGVQEQHTIQVSRAGVGQRAMARSGNDATIAGHETDGDSGCAWAGRVIQGAPRVSDGAAGSLHRCGWVGEFFRERGREVEC